MYLKNDGPIWLPSDTVVLTEGKLARRLSLNSLADLELVYIAMCVNTYLGYR